MLLFKKIFCFSEGKWFDSDVPGDNDNYKFFAKNDKIQIGYKTLQCDGVRNHELMWTRVDENVKNKRTLTMRAHLAMTERLGILNEENFKKSHGQIVPVDVIK